MWTNAAFWAALAAIITFGGKLVFDIETKRYDYWENRRTAIVRFRANIELTQKDLLEQLPGLRSDDYKNKMVALITAQESEGRSFRMFGAEITDPEANDMMLEILVTLPIASQKLVVEVILRERQMIAIYNAMQAEAFENMTGARQIEALEAWLESVAKFSKALDLTTADTRNWSVDHRTYLGRTLGWDPKAG